jgi:hypothetical protein
MKDHQFRCRHCRKICAKRTKDQSYCGRPDCQKARKNAWRRTRYQLDPDYRANQYESTKAWLESQAGGSAAYYRRYRKKRRKQPDDHSDSHQPSAPGRIVPDSTSCANSDAENVEWCFISGIYKLSRCGANSDAILVDLSIIQGG